MKTLEFNKLETIEGGGEIANTITGVCGAILLGNVAGWIALSTPAGWAVGIACVANGAAGAYGWW